MKHVWVAMPIKVSVNLGAPYARHAAGELMLYGRLLENVSLYGHNGNMSYFITPAMFHTILPSSFCSRSCSRIHRTNRYEVFAASDLLMSMYVLCESMYVPIELLHVSVLTARPRRPIAPQHIHSVFSAADRCELPRDTGGASCPRRPSRRRRLPSGGVTGRWRPSLTSGPTR